MSRTPFAILIAISMIISGPTLIAAADATPGASPTAITCSVTPRTSDEVAALVASPVAASPTPVDLAGEQVDGGTLAAIQTTVLQADLCAQSGDFYRLAALYTDDAIRAGVLGSPSTPIEAGTPMATPTAPAATPAPPPTVISAIWVGTDHALATIQRGPALSTVMVALVDGRWLLDGNETPTTSEPGVSVSTPVDGDIPLVVLQAVVSTVSDLAGHPVTSVTITSFEEVEWPDASLGCPVVDGFAAAVITPGYKITAETEGNAWVIHTDMVGNAVSC